MKPILVAMFTWSDFFNWNFNSIFTGLAQTLGMAFLGTFLASLVCIPISFLASRQIFKLGLVRFLIKRFLDIIRGVDILIWAIIYVRAFGLGPFAGLLSIFTVDVGTLGKLFSEAADNADTRQIEGMQSTGASKISVNSLWINTSNFSNFYFTKFIFLRIQYKISSNSWCRWCWRHWIAVN